MQAIIAALTSAVFVVLSLWHMYWALGGRLAHQAALPIKNGKPLFRPSAVGTFVVGLALMAFAALVAVNAGLLGTGGAAPAWLRWAGAAVALALLGRAIGDFRYVGFFKRLGDEPFARLDTRVYSPLCVLLAAGVMAAGWPAYIS
ncbi:DUF3995 domain-containing protein [Achromobacter seleniivolatilans]|uniref:DUF3995 domain-containing protein n=1 Tax=Achromobacter seleniivolatilans TaxID=3047478 RepID=A0ABY9M0D3_9BURK|nr:DUF3995 domain-containing protein [Achromobacter sp. R39]WMD20420.1 DUF3995 domain-containing protein [Achromobacter sp. R39]